MANNWGLFIFAGWLAQSDNVLFPARGGSRFIPGSRGRHTKGKETVRMTRQIFTAEQDGFVGAEDDVLWDTCRYIRRMEERLSRHPHDCAWEALLYRHGTHFAFPDSML